MDEQQFTKPALDKFRQWHFWWLVIFSFLLIITFVYYLPAMFLNQSMAPHDAPSMGMPIDESQPHGHDSSGNSIPEGQEEDHMMSAEGGDEMQEHMEEHMSEGMSMDDHAEEGHEAVYKEESSVKEGLAVNLNINPVPFNTGIPLSMNFFVNQKPGNVPVLANQLQVEHEKLMHVVGVRSDMNEFFHIHPEFLADNPSIFSIDHIFNKPGFYKIWSEIKKDGVNYSFGHPEVNVNGPGSQEEKKVSFSRNVIVGNYQVSMVMSDMAVKGREVDLSFDIHTLTGQEVEVEQYLGADMHLSIIKDDQSQFIHTHPGGGSEADHSHSRAPQVINAALAHGDEEPAGATDEHQTVSSGDEVISFSVTFPEVGLYKAFAQFRPKGIDLPTDQALLAEFWIQVEEEASLPISQWWMLLIISAILIASLSWWVKGYLKVKPEDVQIKK
ncbi:MAG: hypothetical protein Q7S43_03090 [bacterium]|nr:hypothetical protein [bacterium]MDO8496414.1 hypothetical protein [bacterium]